MIRQFHTTTSKPPNRLRSAGRVLVLFAAGAALALAHNGYEHIMGTVSKVANQVLTVKTAKGDVDVALNAKTTFTRNNQKAQFADLKPGVRVVVEVPEGAHDKVAQSVRIGAVPKAAAPDAKHATHQ